jgi:uncharacterized protein YecE (DUF72 family)
MDDIASPNAIQVGCCGFGISRDRYYQSFSCVEVQQTFYQPPAIKTLESWRRNAPQQFEFALKAWQLITHTSASPTFRRLSTKMATAALNEAGGFKLTPLVRDAMEITLASADALTARAVLFQCPASFKENPQNLENMRNFFSHYKPATGVRFYWEPRGSWKQSTIDLLCNDLQLAQAIDPFSQDNGKSKSIYHRLHGKKSWRYEFTTEDEQWLASKVKATNQNGAPAYIFFNNRTMVENALQFKQLL